MNIGDPKRAGKAPKYLVRFTMRDIAMATGKTMGAMRKDRQRGNYDPRDLSSLAAYIMRCQAKANRPRKSRKRKALPVEPPKEPESTS